MRVLIRLLRLAAPFRWWLALAVLLGFATIGSGIGLIATSAYLIARAAVAGSIAELQVAIVGVRFFGLARGLFRYAERYAGHWLTFRLLARLRVWLYQALEPLAPAGLVDARSGDLLSRMVADVETLEHLFARAIAPPAVALLATALATALVGRLDAGLGLVLLALLLLTGLGLPALMLALNRAPGAAVVSAQAALSAALVDAIQGLPDLLAFGREADVLAAIAAPSRELGRSQERMAGARGLGAALLGFGASLASLALLVLAIPLVSQGTLDGVWLPLVALVALASFEAVAPLTGAAEELSRDLAAARRLFAVVDQPPPVVDEAEVSPAPAHAGLRVRGLGFRYAADQPPALHDVGFDLPPGGRLAIVGPSGAGKTTLFSLLLRLWDYDTGTIELGGQPLRAYRAQDVRGMIAVVPQAAHLFAGTLRENIALARPDATLAAIESAARSAGLRDWIASLPHGYDTWVGEHGLRLSGGERQRVAIARALLRDAPILLLDEPTAHLDGAAAAAFWEMIDTRLAGRTLLVITHRLAGVERFDQILVLDQGRIVERGSHAALMAAGGLYCRLWAAQLEAAPR